MSDVPIHSAPLPNRSKVCIALLAWLSGLRGQSQWVFTCLSSALMPACTMIRKGCCLESVQNKPAPNVHINSERQKQHRWNIMAEWDTNKAGAKMIPFINPTKASAKALAFRGQLNASLFLSLSQHREMKLDGLKKITAYFAAAFLPWRRQWKYW